ncbi:MAG TPA: hypothetical protein VN687_07260 [Blastocatellia bacterium]|nr:hypothetical protein [Blastocatellia bacterium]
MTERGRYAQLRRKRLLVGFAGFLIGLAVGAPVNYVSYGRYFDFTTFAFGIAGAAITLLLGERKNLPTAEEVRGLHFKAKLNPLELRYPDSMKVKQGPNDLTKKTRKRQA